MTAAPVWSDSEWRVALEKLLREHPPIARLERDPVRFPHAAWKQGRARPQVEQVALLSAMLAYGRVAAFMAALDAIFSVCDYRLSTLFETPPSGWRWPAYRLSRGADIAAFAEAICRVTDRRGGLWESFRQGWAPRRDILDGLAALRNDLLAAAPRPRHTRGFLHLLPAVGETCRAKRWMLFLRWMVRRTGGVDLGLWMEIPPSSLIIPLDRHIAFLGRAFGWTRRRTDDLRAAREITAVLRRFAPRDPLRYDFALCHLGISGHCRPARGGGCSPACWFQRVCRARPSGPY